MQCMIDHEKVELTAYDGGTAKIDIDMEPLSTMLTRHRIVVRKACQGRVRFIDQTHYEAGGHRAEIWLVHDDISMAFLQGLLIDSHFFSRKNFWTIQFDWVPNGPHKDEKRISLSFPPQDIQPLIDYIKMKDEMVMINTFNGDISGNIFPGYNE